MHPAHQQLGHSRDRSTISIEHLQQVLDRGQLLLRIRPPLVRRSADALQQILSATRPASGTCGSRSSARRSSRSVSAGTAGPLGGLRAEQRRLDTPP